RDGKDKQSLHPCQIASKLTRNRSQFACSARRAVEQTQALQLRALRAFQAEARGEAAVRGRAGEHPLDVAAHGAAAAAILQAAQALQLRLRALHLPREIERPGLQSFANDAAERTVTNPAAIEIHVEVHVQCAQGAGFAAAQEVC